MNMLFHHPVTLVKRAVSEVSLSYCVTLSLCLLGSVAVCAGIWHLKKPVNHDGIMKSAAMANLVDSGETLCSEITRSVEPAMLRTRILASSPKLVAALASKDHTQQTAECNKDIADSTEVDAIALFDSEGNIVAINTVYASGKPIPQERVDRIMRLSFSNRDIIRKCEKNDSAEGQLEFQTTCDITPAFFDSTGLSVAYSVPVVDPSTGKRLGVVSSRMRFDRLSNLIQRRAVGGSGGSTEFITDQGTYFSEAINSGKRQPPVPTSVLAGIVQPLLKGDSNYCFTQQGNDYVCLFRLHDFETLVGGGIQVMLVADEDWLASEVRQAQFFNCGVLICLGLFMFLCAMVIRAMSSLRQSERWNRLLIDSSLDAVIAVDEMRLVRNWNPRAEQTFGYTAKEACGRCIDELIVTRQKMISDESEGASFYAIHMRHSQKPLEVQAIRRDGIEITLESVVKSLEVKNKKWQCIFSRDVTEQRATEMHLGQSQKLESIGQMAAGIAHEINTPTQYVGDNTRFIRDNFKQILLVMDRQHELLNLGSDARQWGDRFKEIEALRASADLNFLIEEIPKALEQSIEGLDRIARIVRAMKEFSHPGGDSKEPADLNAAIQSTCIVCQNHWKSIGELQLDLDPALPRTDVLLGQFNQVILNLIVNAADAIADAREINPSLAGRIRISTRPHDGHVEIKVQDNGPGIPPDVAKRIFEPFFTTKPVGKGTGQGLMLSRSVIVKKHGGTLRFEPAAGGGTAFVITLPIQDSQTQLREAA